MINCPKCKDVEMIWGNDWDNDDDMDSQYLIWSQYSCPKCEQTQVVGEEETLE